MHRIVFRFMAILLMITLSAGTSLAATQIGLTHGTNKQRPEFSFTPGASYHLKSAKNEWEPFAVLIRDDSGLTGVDVTVTEFTGPGDPITTIELYRAHYVPVPLDNISHLPQNLAFDPRELSVICRRTGSELPDSHKKSGF